MELPFKVDLSNVSATGIAQIIFPLFPGGTLLLGFCAGRPDLAGRLFDLPRLGYFTKAVIALFAAYVGGLFLSHAVIGLFAGLGGLIGTAMGSRMPWRSRPWTDDLWRQTAQRFIGERFTPILEHPMPNDLLKMQLDAASQALPGTAAQDDLKRKIDLWQEQGKRMGADFLWSRWFWVLESYFAFPDQPAANLSTYMFEATYCTAWAVMLLMYWSPFHNKMAWAVCLIIVGLYLLNSFFLYLNPHYEKASANRQTAAMLRFLTQIRAPQVERPGS